MSTVDGRPVALKDLDAKRFERLYDTDRLTATILANRLRYIVNHVCTQLFTHGFSPWIRDLFDFSASVVGPPQLNYATPAVFKTLQSFSGAIRDAIANTIEEFGRDNLAPGDLLICNDPYRIGAHVNDICFIRPIFTDGEISCFLVVRAHMIDIGGVVPNGMSGTKRNVYENGLVLPPMLLWHDDKPVKSTYSLILDNTRFGELLLADVETISQSLRLGEGLLRETIDRYGVPAFLGTCRYACDVTAEATARALASLPDGEYTGEDFLDCDAIDDEVSYRVAVRVRKHADRLEVWFDGCSAQARTSVNCAWLDTKAMVALTVKVALDPLSPFTSGVFRNIDIVLPSGTIVSAEPPDGAIMLTYEAKEPALAAGLRALNGVLGELSLAGGMRAGSTHSMSGTTPDGRAWSNVFGSSGGWGANSAGDADSGQKSFLGNIKEGSVEVVEQFTPVAVMRNEYLVDSGGPGRFRGGASIVKDTYWLCDGRHLISDCHARTATGDGAAGGHDGALGGVWLWPAEAVDELGGSPYVTMDDDRTWELSTPVAGMMDARTHRSDANGAFFHWGRTPVWEERAGAVFRRTSMGGGGWGDPFARDVDAVARDVRDGYVSIVGARRDFGVVVLGDPETDPEGLTVDAKATARLRAAGPRPLDTSARRRSLDELRARQRELVPSVPTEPVQGSCPECGAAELRSYPVIAEAGWEMVVKCQECLCSVQREPWHRLGFIRLLEDRIEP